MTSHIMHQISNHNFANEQLTNLHYPLFTLALLAKPLCIRIGVGAPLEREDLSGSDAFSNLILSSEEPWNTQ